jgi:protein-S-isoprenylcysteine O-methyltransferase Ste14
LTKSDTDRKPFRETGTNAGHLGTRRDSTDPPGEALSSIIAWGGALLFVFSLGYYLYAYLVRFGRVTVGGSALVAIAADFGLFSAFALHHSTFARLGVKNWVVRRMPAALERSAYTWASSALFLAVCSSWVSVPGALYWLTGWAAWPAYAAQAAGLLLIIRGAAALDVLDLAGVRQVLDARAGTAPRHVPLETSGVYGLVRHPLYFGWALFVFGAPHMTATRFAFACISTAYLAMAIPWEERSLIQVFGAQYDAYRKRVRWRMLPGLY